MKGKLRNPAYSFPQRDLYAATLFFPCLISKRGDQQKKYARNSERERGVGLLACEELGFLDEQTEKKNKNQVPESFAKMKLTLFHA
jgi:hypothetical protein